MHDLLGTSFLYPHCGQTGIIDAAFLHPKTEKQGTAENVVHAKFCLGTDLVVGI